MKYYLYTHIGSGNRGCEATAKSLYQILNISKEDYYIFSENYDEEKVCKTEQYASVFYTPNISGIKPIGSIGPRLLTKLKIDKLASVKYRYKKLIKEVEKNSKGLSTGGDVFCYEQELANKIGYLTDEMKRKGIKCFLMACSINKDHLTEDTINILKKFDYIFPRESYTEKYLTEKGFTNIKRFPDPAFALPIEYAKELELSKEKQYIGINYSTYTNQGTEINDNFKTIVRFIRNVINNTEMNIVLIPHVYWNEENDVKLLKKIKQEFPDEKRVLVVEKKYTSSQLKFLISQCRFFIGSRTHSVIAAYSSGVPTLALGYSIKSKGIAQDIFGEYDPYVFDSKKLSCYENFYNKFESIIENENKIKYILREKNTEFTDQLKSQIELLEKM